MSMTHADNMSDAIKEGLDHLPEKRYLQLAEHVDEFHDDHELLEKIVEMINESGQSGCFDEIYTLLKKAGKL